MRVVVEETSVAWILRWTQRALLSCAIVLLGYCAYVVTDSWLFQRRANLDLQRLLNASQDKPTEVADAHEPTLNKPFAAASPRTPIDIEGLVGRIDVDRLGVSVMVVDGVEESDLEHAAGHIAGTVLPGETGNIGIAAHRDTFFRPLRDIRRNDVIRFTTPSGEFQYRVVSTKIVDPDDVSVLSSDQSARS